MAAPSSTHWGRARNAVVWEVLTAAIAELGPAPLHILDAGGGTGGFAVPLAALGHRVTVVDPSPDSLASLGRRAAEEAPGRELALTAVQGDLDSLLDAVDAGTVDVVLCHHVLEVVDEPSAGLANVAAAVRPGGIVSVLAANRTAAVVARAVSGHFAEAAAALDDEAGRWGPADPAQRRFSRDELVGLLAQHRLDAFDVHGVRVFTDLVPGALVDGDSAATDALVALERSAARRSPYAELAAALHVLARRTTT